jgi:hypothetical protein
MSLCVQYVHVATSFLERNVSHINSNTSLPHLPAMLVGDTVLLQNILYQAKHE